MINLRTIPNAKEHIKYLSPLALRAQVGTHLGGWSQVTSPVAQMNS